MDISDLEYELIGTCISITAIAGLVGNSYIYLQFKNKKINKNIFLTNIILSNIAVIVLTFPLTAFSSFQYEWIISDTLCYYYGTVSLLFSFVTIISILMLIIDNYLASHFKQYEMNKKKLRNYMVIWIWGNALFWSFAPLFGWSTISYDPTSISCTVDLMNPDFAYFSYIAVCFVIVYLAPFVLLFLFRNRFLQGNHEILSSSRSTMTNSSALRNRRNFLLLLSVIIVWIPSTTVYVWPMFDYAENIAPIIAIMAAIMSKLMVVTIPYIIYKYPN